MEPGRPLSACEAFSSPASLLDQAMSQLNARADVDERARVFAALPPFHALQPHWLPPVQAIQPLVKALQPQTFGIQKSHFCYEIFFLHPFLLACILCLGIVLIFNALSRR